MGRLGSQVAPPSRVRANHAGPVAGTSGRGLAGTAGSATPSRRSHTTNTRRPPGSVGSAVTDSLSLKALPLSRLSVTGSCHVAPPSTERLTSTAVVTVSRLTDRLVW